MPLLDFSKKGYLHHMIGRQDRIIWGTIELVAYAVRNARRAPSVLPALRSGVVLTGRDANRTEVHDRCALLEGEKLRTLRRKIETRKRRRKKFGDSALDPTLTSPITREVLKVRYRTGRLSRPSRTIAPARRRTRRRRSRPRSESSSTDRACAARQRDQRQQKRIYLHVGARAELREAIGVPQHARARA